jgi:hypothetical protein
LYIGNNIKPKILNKYENKKTTPLSAEERNMIKDCLADLLINQIYSFKCLNADLAKS